MSRQRITTGDVRRSFNPAIKQTFLCRHVYRPLGDVLTPPLYNIGCTANTVTYLRMLLSVGSLFGLAVGTATGVLLYLFGYYLIYVLDCVDGNLARLRDDVSYWGKYVDGIADSLLVTFSPVAAGIGLWQSQGVINPLVVGSLISLAAGYVQMLRSRLSFFRDWMTTETGALDQRISDTVDELVRGERHLVSGAEFLRSVTPPLLLAPTGLWGFAVVLFIVEGIVDLMWGVLVTLQGHTMLRRHRISRHAASGRETERDR